MPKDESARQCVQPNFFARERVDENGQEQIIHHLDLYRLRSLDEALGIGIEDYLYDECYCLIEWPEIISELLPNEMIFIKIITQPDESRLFLISDDNDIIN